MKEGTSMAVNGRMIVDAQAHLWKAESPDWKWVPGPQAAACPSRSPSRSSLPLMDEAGVDRVVIVPPSWPGDRNDYALEAAKRYPNRFAVMGRLPIEKREVGEAAAAEVEGAARHAGRPADVPERHDEASDRRPRRLVLAGWPRSHGLPVMFFAPAQHPEVRADRRAASRADHDHRPHEPQPGDRQGGQDQGVDRHRGGAREISERLGQDFLGADLFVRALSVAAT